MAGELEREGELEEGKWAVDVANWFELLALPQQPTDEVYEAPISTSLGERQAEANDDV